MEHHQLSTRRPASRTPVGGETGGLGRHQRTTKSDQVIRENPASCGTETYTPAQNRQTSTSHKIVSPGLVFDSRGRRHLHLCFIPIPAGGPWAACHSRRACRP